MIPPLARLGGSTVVEAIDRGATICVATQRLARALHQAWNDLMLEGKHRVWRTPDIIPLSAWQRRIASELNVRSTDAASEALPILEQQQELLTWEQAALAAGVLSDALQPLQLSAAMMDAHALAVAWDIQIDESDALPGTDTAAFLAVREQAEVRWRQLGAVPAAILPLRAIEAIRMLPQLLPEEIMFIGFDLPADAALRSTLQALRNSGTRVTMVTSPHAPADGKLLQFPCFEDELHDAAQWCGELLERGEGDIGIIIPHLDSVRTLAQRVFGDVLQPSTATQQLDGKAALFELSLGPRAIDEPLIDAAFLVLDLQRSGIAIEQWTRILHSPFIRGADRWGDKRALLDVELRRRGLREASAADVTRAAARIEHENDDPLIAVLSSVAFDNVRRSAADWTAAFLRVLEACGWPGDRGLNSREYQARERFRDLLEEFAGLDVVMAPVQLVEALARFRRLASERVFQVKSVRAPVQIMGVRESAGLRFSHCRVLGMNDDIWPPSPHPIAFVPIRLQRSAGIPAAVPERFLEQVREETALLFRCAEQVTFTCSAADGDRELLPSPLLSSLAMESRRVQRRDAVHLIAGSDRLQLQTLRDDKAPPMDIGEYVRGGTTIISLQSACPFRAFVDRRLHAARPEEVEHGVRAIDRGNLIHRSLEAFWRKLKTHSQLTALSDTDLRKLLQEVIDQSFEQEKYLGPRRVAEHLLEAERECLLLLLYDWVTMEKARLPFEAKELELKKTINLSGLPLEMKIDRIDELSDGSQLVIDYKSGNKSVADWMALRPSEPQVPLYLQASDNHARAAAFAIVRRGESHFAGLKDDDVPMNELSSASEYLAKKEMDERDWQSLQRRWTSILEGLASEFLSGHAAVDPRDGADTCEYCKLSACCRIDSVNIVASGEEDE
ncbi:MAG: PD-(D/E)XK nuclease family protein [Bacteroidota bacterium]